MQTLYANRYAKLAKRIADWVAIAVIAIGASFSLFAVWFLYVWGFGLGSGILVSIIFVTASMFAAALLFAIGNAIAQQFELRNIGMAQKPPVI
jgi:hypothetical protein